MHFKYKLNKVLQNKEKRNEMLSLGIKGLIITLLFPLIYIINIFDYLYHNHKIGHHNHEIGIKKEISIFTISILFYVVVFNINWYYTPIILLILYMLITSILLIETAFDQKLDRNELRDAKLKKLIKK